MAVQVGMLAGQENLVLDAGQALERLGHRSHLDGFRPGPDD
jgi:hypothetical protein